MGGMAVYAFLSGAVPGGREHPMQHGDRINHGRSVPIRHGMRRVVVFRWGQKRSDRPAL